MLTGCAYKFDAVLSWELAYPVLFTSSTIFHVVAVVGMEWVPTVAVRIVE